jgi:CheY-like chemotaxis protein
MPHLLLVDDDDSFRESLGLNLLDEGYEVTSVASGRDALGFLQGGGSVDVVLLDWRMPNRTTSTFPPPCRNPSASWPLATLVTS